MAAPANDLMMIEADNDLDKEFATVNLMRMRGLYEEARTHCLAILKEDAHHPVALELMGDVQAESGNLESAERYYGSALDSNPGSPQLIEKLATLRSRIDDHRQAEIAKRIGLSARPQIFLFVVTAIALLSALAMLGYSIGRHYSASAKPMVITVPVDVAKNAVQPMPQAPTADDKKPIAPPIASITADSLIAKALTEKSSFAAQFIAAAYDPRIKSADIAFVHTLPITRSLVADMAVDALTHLPDLERITLRVVHEGEIVAAATLERTKLNQVTSQEIAAVDAISEFWSRSE